MIFVLVIEHNFSLCHNSHTTVCFYLWNTGLVTGLATAPPPTPPPLKNIWKWQKTSRCNFLSYFFFCNAKTQRGLFHRFLKQVVNLSCSICLFSLVVSRLLEQNKFSFVELEKNRKIN